MDFESFVRGVCLNDDVRYAGSSTVRAGQQAHAQGTDSIVTEQRRASSPRRHSASQCGERFATTMGRARFAYVEREKLSILTLYMEESYF